MGPADMNQLTRSVRVVTSGFLAVICCLAAPSALWAQAGDEASGGETTPFVIKKRSEFGCAEVDDIKAGGLASHEITVDPRRVERCLREKVGSRFHECKRLDFEEATSDQTGVVTFRTDEGPVQFWIEEQDSKRVMVWTWPDSDKKYMCAGKSSRR